MSDSPFPFFVLLKFKPSSKYLSDNAIPRDFDPVNKFGELSEVNQWLNDNAGIQHYDWKSIRAHNMLCYYFKNQDVALMFKLAFGDRK